MTKQRTVNHDPFPDSGKNKKVKSWPIEGARWLEDENERYTVSLYFIRSMNLRLSYQIRKHKTLHMIHTFPEFQRGPHVFPLPLLHNNQARRAGLESRWVCFRHNCVSSRSYRGPTMSSSGGGGGGSPQLEIAGAAHKKSAFCCCFYVVLSVSPSSQLIFPLCLYAG